MKKLERRGKMSDTSKHSKLPATNPKKKQSDKPSRRQASVTAGDHIFVSYSRDDRDYVTKLANWLEGHGVKVWFDHDIDYGAKWEAEIQKKLETSTVVLVVMSKSARNSSWVGREVDRAKQLKILIFPVLLEPDGIVDRVADLQFENIVGGQMPGLRFCQKLPGFLVREMDIANALNVEQRNIAKRIVSAAGSGLHKGSKGPGVAALQTELLRVGLDPGTIDGVFGEKTAGAVREFQERRCHIPTADGIVGPLTWNILVNSSLGDLAPTTCSGNNQRA
jgi:hypothetical protein